MLHLLIIGLQLLAAALLALIAWQDWRTRSVSWPAFPLLTGCLLAGRLLTEPAALVGAQSLCNGLVLLLLLATLALYVRLRFRRAGRRLRDCLGSGDVLLWGALAVYLAPPALLLFLLLTSLGSLLLVAGRVVRPLPGQAVLTVPLAGLQAAALLLLLGGQQLLPPAAQAWPYSLLDSASAWMLTSLS